jgi:ParB-like nuclease domain
MAASNRPAKKKKAASANGRRTEDNVGIVGGEVRLRKLDLFAPNAWNPNQMEPEEFESLKAGLRAKGWVRSDALLVWGTNEDGAAQNLIINGEHRWRAAGEIGMEVGPVVTMDGISREEAVQWTIRLDKARGRFDPEKLRLTLRNELDFRNRDDAFVLQLGFTGQEARDLRVQIPAVGGRTPGGMRDPGEEDPSAADFQPDNGEQPRLDKIKRVCPKCGEEIWV